MKYLLIFSLSLFSLNALADSHKMDHKMDHDWQKKWDAMSFEDAKKMKTEKLATKKEMIEEAQGCVDKTKDKKGLEKCWDEMKEAKMEMHDKMMKKM